MKIFLLKISVFSLLFTLLAGCAGTELEPGAEKVSVKNSSQAQNCRYVGPVSSRSVNGVTYAYTSHRSIDQAELANLKNEAHQLGANCIVVTKHNSTYENMNGESVVDSDVMEAKAYNCGMNMA